MTNLFKPSTGNYSRTPKFCNISWLYHIPILSLPRLLCSTKQWLPYQKPISYEFSVSLKQTYVSAHRQDAHSNKLPASRPNSPTAAAKTTPEGGDPQGQGSDPATSNAEHPGPAPPGVSKGTGGGATKKRSAGHGKSNETSRRGEERKERV